MRGLCFGALFGRRFFGGGTQSLRDTTWGFCRGTAPIEVRKGFSSFPEPGYVEPPCLCADPRMSRSSETIDAPLRESRRSRCARATPGPPTLVALDVRSRRCCSRAARRARLARVSVRVLGAEDGAQLLYFPGLPAALKGQRPSRRSRRRRLARDSAHGGAIWPRPPSSRLVLDARRRGKLRRDVGPQRARARGRSATARATRSSARSRARRLAGRRSRARARWSGCSRGAAGARARRARRVGARRLSRRPAATGARLAGVAVRLVVYPKALHEHGRGTRRSA